MDVLDIAFAPGVPASTPGGMTTEELLDGVLAAGRHPKVKAMDIVCLDPLKDSHVQATVKLGTHVFLLFSVGSCCESDLNRIECLKIQQDHPFGILGGLICFK